VITKKVKSKKGYTPREAFAPFDETPRTMSTREISKGLGVAVSTAHKFIKAGCPVNSIEAAREWVKARAHQPPPPPSETASLTEARRRKLELECQLLAIKVEREAANAEFLPVPEVLEAVRVFLRFAHLALRMRCETFAERAAAAQTPQQAISILRTLTDEGWATGAIAAAAQTPASRMKRAIADLILEQFPKATDADLRAWAASLGFDLDAELTISPAR
jgi:hypothetical protein